MSYSISVTAKDKADAKAQCETKMDEVVKAQPNHAKDKAAALANANAAIDLLQDDPAQDVAVSMSGSLSWADDPEKITGASISSNAYLMQRD